ncbi:MAG: hypothetical protein J6C01_03890 [Lachnospiraceae bacterium]|nr:hypothetical protein [Lachnospiraceae bacterium]
MKLRKIVISVLLLVFGLCIAMDNDMGLVYATANDEFKFEQASYQYVLYDESDSYTLNITKGVESCVSSDSNIVKVSSVYSYSGHVNIYVYSAGTVTLTATDASGNKTTCTITVTYPEFKFEQSVNNVDMTQYDYEYKIYFAQDGSEPLSWQCSNSVAISSHMGIQYDYVEDKYYLSVKINKAGTYKITATDKYGRTAECTVNVNVPSLTTPTINIELYNELDYSDFYHTSFYDEIKKKFEAYCNISGSIKNVEYVMEVADKTIVSASLSDNGYRLSSIHFVAGKTGSTTVTISDANYSQRLVFNVTVKDYTTTTKIEPQSDAYYNKNSVTIEGVGADGCRYEIYRSTSKNGKYKKVKTTNSRYFNDKNVKPDKKYYYKVRIQLEKGAEWGAFSKPVAYWTAPKTLGKKYVEKDVDNKQTITWKKVKGADGYYIHEYWLEFRGYNIFGKRLYYSYDKTLGTKKRKYTIKHSNYYTGEVTVIPYAKHNGKYYVHGENLMTSLKSYEMHK